MARYVVYIRRPTTRNGVDDPAVVDWNREKERKLWRLLKDSSADVDWPGLAKYFDVSEIYILQQAAWLYEKELKLLQHKMTQINAHTRAVSASQRRPETHQRPLVQTNRQVPNASSPQHVPMPPRLNVTPRLATRASSSPIHSPASSSSSLSSPRRMLSMSRAFPSEEEVSSQSEHSFEGFIPGSEQSDQSQFANSGITSSSENSLTRSALEDALMSRPYRIDSAGESTGISSPGSPR